MNDLDINDPKAPKRRDQKTFKLTGDYLSRLHNPGVDETLLEKYMHLPVLQSRPDSLAGIYSYLLDSARNAGMKAGVIGKAIGGFQELGRVLGNFDPVFVLEAYGEEWPSLLDIVEKKLHPNGQICRSPRSIWPNYCQTTPYRRPSLSLNLVTPRSSTDGQTPSMRMIGRTRHCRWP